MQTVSWQLYFDRTFELLYGGSPASQNDPGVIGVQADVLQFMQFTGVLASLSSSQANAVLGTPAQGNAPTSGGHHDDDPLLVVRGQCRAAVRQQQEHRRE
jgi:hypothetical protein